MKSSGYYEVIHHTEALTGLKMRALAGNVQFNRLHWHDSLEILCCLHGSFSMRFPAAHSQGAELLMLKEGDLITVNCGVPHEILKGTQDGLQLIFSVDASLLRLKEGEYYAFSTVGQETLAQKNPDILEVRSAIARLVCFFPPESDERWYQIHLELYRILTALSRHKDFSAAFSKPAGSLSRFLRCVEVVHRDYQKPLSAALLASEIGFSEPTVYRLFQTHMGMSFTEYVNSVRISAACGLLVHTDEASLSMTELAANCGFLSLSNFYRAFHQFTGCSPREYRKLSQEALTKGDISDSFLKQGFPAIAGRQQSLLQLNQFHPLSELPEEFSEKIKRLAESDS